MTPPLRGFVVRGEQAKVKYGRREVLTIVLGGLCIQIDPVICEQSGSFFYSSRRRPGSSATSRNPFHPVARDALVNIATITIRFKSPGLPRYVLITEALSLPVRKTRQWLSA
jgi:hypothetical protein